MLPGYLTAKECWREIEKDLEKGWAWLLFNLLLDGNSSSDIKRTSKSKTSNINSQGTVKHAN